MQFRNHTTVLGNLRAVAGKLIGTVIVLLLWLHLTSIAIHAGAAVNARLERSEGA